MSSSTGRNRLAAVFVLTIAASVMVVGAAEAVTKSGSKTCPSNAVFTTSVQISGNYQGFLAHSPGGAQEDIVNGSSGTTVVSKFMYASHNGGTHTWSWTGATMSTPTSVCEL